MRSGAGRRWRGLTVSLPGSLPAPLLAGLAALWLAAAAAIVPAAAQAPRAPAGSQVVIAGASGKTGRLIVDAAIAAGLRVRALTSDLARARAELGAQRFAAIEWREVDVRDAAGVRAAVAGADYVISAIGARVFEGPMSPEFIDYGGTVNLIEAARAAKVRRFVMLSSAAAGPHRDHSQAPMLGQVRLWKTRAELALRASGLEYVVVGPAGLLDTPAGRDGLRVLRREDYVSTNVSRADVARVVVDVLRNDDAAGKSFALIGDRPGDPEQWRAELRALPRDAGAGAVVTPPRRADLQQLAWLAGHWASSGEGGGWSEEIWLAPQGTLMPGLGREVRENGRTQFEYLRIEARADGTIVYIASPGGRTPTEFPLRELGTMRVTFANPDHDFPRSLSYWREGNMLRARLEGVVRGETRTQEFRWTLRREP